MGFADLERALEHGEEATWTAAAALADRLDATAAFLAGLRLTPAGRGLAERLGVVAAPSLDVLLVGDRARSAALTLERFACADDRRTRLSFVCNKLFPPRPSCATGPRMRGAVGQAWPLRMSLR